MIVYDIISITSKEGGTSMKPSTINTFQLKLPDELNRKIKSSAAHDGVTKHDWILKAIMKQLTEQNKAV